MKTIPLTQGKVAIVDDDDYDSLSQHKWYAHKNRHTYYATRQFKLPNGNQKSILMHRVILGLQPDDSRECDHRDGNGLNNCRSNIRFCTSSENRRHQRLNCKNNSGFKGVSIEKRNSSNPYRAYIKVNYKQVHLGYYQIAEAAARAYDIAAITHYGDFALTNRMLGLL